MKKLFAILFSVFLAFNANGATLINDTEIEKQITEIIKPVANAADISEKRRYFCLYGLTKTNKKSKRTARGYCTRIGTYYRRTYGANVATHA